MFKPFYIKYQFTPANLYFVFLKPCVFASLRETLREKKGTQRINNNP